VVGVNVVPATGWFFEGWSAGTTLAVYWIENVAACLFVTVRIVVHRRLSPSRGHFRYQAPSADRRSARRSSFLGGFLLTSLVFCAAHGIFLGVILFLLGRNGEGSLAGVSWRSVGVGCTIVFAFLVVDLGMDLLRVRRCRSCRSSRLPIAASGVSSSSI